MPATKQAIENKELNICVERLDYLDNVLQDFIKKDLFQFIIVRAHRNGIPIYQANYGENTKPYGITQDAMSSVASVTKTITAVLLLKMQEDALIDLVDPVHFVFPEFETHMGDVCFWHLLTHTSGIEDHHLGHFVGTYIEKILEIKKPQDNATDQEWDEYHGNVNEKMGLNRNADYNEHILKFIKIYKPEHKPRTMMAYCNTGFNILGKVIEKVTGMPIDEYSRKVLFEPLGMNDSHFVVPKEKFERMIGRKEGCMGYPWINSKDNYTKNTSGAGGLKTTVSDLCRFADMVVMNGNLDGKRVLSPASIRAMTQNHNYAINNGIQATLGLPDGGREAWDTWGLGWNLHGNKKDDAGILRYPGCVEHGGWAGHKVLADPEAGLSCAIFKGEYDPPGKNPFGLINNVLYSALD